MKKRALNLVKKIKFRKEEEKRETKIKDTEEPDIDISIEEIRRRIRQEKEVAAGEAQDCSGLDESTDSDFTITYEETPRSPHQDSFGIGADRSSEVALPRMVEAEEEGQEKEAVREKAERLSPKQRHRRQALARSRNKEELKSTLIPRSHI